LQLLKVAAHALDLGLDSAALRRRRTAKEQKLPVVTPERMGIGSGSLKFVALFLGGLIISGGMGVAGMSQRGYLRLQALAIDPLRPDCPAAAQANRHAQSGTEDPLPNRPLCRAINHSSLATHCGVNTAASAIKLSAWLILFRTFA
jgi:hypothetical protein